MFPAYDKNMDQAVQDQIAILKTLIVETIPVEQIYLFGSYAYGTPTPDSDLDLYVIMKDDAPLPEIEAEQKIALASLGRKSTNPAAERTGYGCFGKVFVSGYIPFLSPQRGGVCTLRIQSMPADILVSKKSRFQRRLTAPTLEREVAARGIVIYG
jgi:predicted nucleotidyltransferase